MLGRKRTDELVVGDEMMQIREDCTLVDEQGLVFSLCSGTRAFTILVDGVRRGLVFLGRGDYALNSEIRIHGAKFSKLVLRKL